MHDLEVNEVLAEVKRRATIDPEFRTLALRDGAAAIKKVSNKTIEGAGSIRFVDNSGPVKTIPLPDALADIEELSDVELEQVAGGDVSTGVTWRR